MINIDLTTIHTTCKFSPRALAFYAEAASVMLARVHPAPPPPSTGTYLDHSDNEPENVLNISWNAPDNIATAAHGNPKDATEHGAYAIAIAAMEAIGYRVVGRPSQGSGADFVMIRDGDPEENFMKLEVSGIFEGGNIGARLGVKTVQVRGGTLNRPGRAVIVRFRPLHVAVGGWA